MIILQLIIIIHWPHVVVWHTKKGKGIVICPLQLCIIFECICYYRLFLNLPSVGKDGHTIVRNKHDASNANDRSANDFQKLIFGVFLRLSIVSLIKFHPIHLTVIIKVGNFSMKKVVWIRLATNSNPSSDVRLVVWFGIDHIERVTFRITGRI